MTDHNRVLLSVPDGRYFALVADELFDVRHEAVRQLVHAADWLEERRLPFVVLGLIHPIQPELGAEDFDARNGRLDVARRKHARLRGVSRTLRADVLLL